MVAQTSYTKEMAPSVPGVIAWDFGTADTTSLTATGVVPFGVAVTKAGVPGKVDVKGFAIRDLMSRNAIETNKTEYGATETIGLVREGYLYVRNDSPSTTLAADESVFIDADGKVVATGDTGAVELKGCSIELGGAAGKVILIRVHINRPQA